MNPVLLALSGLWLFLPALIPNSAAVVFGGGTPLDFGRSWNGKRILGDGKTWRGLLGGVLTGGLVGMVQLFVAAQVDPAGFLGFGPFPSCVALVFALALGSLLGDAGGAFVKRRLGMQRGAKVVGLDQYDFVIGALVLSLILFPSWFLQAFIDGEAIIALVVLLIVVPLLHRAVNVVGYRAGLKKEPW
jgi:CDP-2,3-bis-(O-geranylgeranyl)-sn-glycerol synthase